MKNALVGLPRPINQGLQMTEEFGKEAGRPSTNQNNVINTLK